MLVFGSSLSHRNACITNQEEQSLEMPPQHAGQNQIALSKAVVVCSCGTSIRPLKK